MVSLDKTEAPGWKHPLAGWLFTMGKAPMRLRVFDKIPAPVFGWSSCLGFISKKLL